MTRALRLPMLLVWLTVLWVALWGDVSAANVIGGLAVAFAVVVVGRPTGVSGLERGYFRPLAALSYAGYFLFQLVRSNLLVAWEIVTPTSRINRAIIAVPLHTSSDAVVTLIANTITLTPGTVTIDVDRPDPDAPPTLYVHLLMFAGLDAARRQVLELERRAVRAFGSPADLAAVNDALARQGAG